MKRYSRILIIVNLLLLLGYFNWSVYKKEQTLKDGQLVLLELAPVDPRSLMQGDYMRLNYKESGSESVDNETPLRGYAILKIDSNRVGKVIRLQDSPEFTNGDGNGNGDEIAIKYKIIKGRLFLGAESFFFEEGQDTLYQKAKYGGLKVNHTGESLLVGLYDKELVLINAENM